MDSIISTFHIDWKIIIAQAINFAVVFVVLYLFALKPLSKLMAERAERIKKGIDDAKKNDEILKRTNAEYEETLTKARVEAGRIAKESKKDLETQKISILEEAKMEAKRILDEGKKALEIEKVKAVADVKKDIAILSMQEAEKILSSKKDLNNL